MPHRVSEWLPQCGQASGVFAVSGARAIREIAGIREGRHHPVTHHGFWKKSTRKIGPGLHARGAGVAYGYWRARVGA